MGRTRLLLPIIFGLSLLPSAALARRVMDPEYAYRPSAQRDWVRRHITNIVSPTITFPALVEAGGRAPVVVRLRDGGSARALLSRPETQWIVSLRRRSTGASYRCRIVKTEARGQQVTLQAEVPLDLARDVYDLDVVGPGIDDSQPNAVRVTGHGNPDVFRFAVFADHQLWDPSFKLRGSALTTGTYPKQEGEAVNIAMARQVMHELGLQDLDFALHLGDLIFGVNYPQEYEEAHDLLTRSQLPVFAVPGNHDAYAEYVVRLRSDGALRLVAGALGCRKHLEGNLDWRKTWVFISCLYGDVKHLLYADLHRDGLTFWQRQFGPPVYAFDHGRLHFVGINTYDGTPERRHAFSVYMEVFDLHLGAPAVDNYGGYVTDEQLAFIEREARRAEQSGRTLVVFGHHDPRGNDSGRRYHPNQAFPTDPLSMGGFEEWNYDSSTWDSDPHDLRSNETAEANSAHKLLRILAHHGGYYLHGHAHDDGRRVYEPGSTIAGIPVRRRLELIRTTTASAGCNGEGYWGYRVIEARGGELAVVDYDPARRLASVPAGNLWASQSREGRRTDYDLVSGLPRPTEVTLRWELPTLAEGYRFRARAVEDTEAALALKEPPPRVLRIAAEQGVTTYFVRVQAPGAGAFPPKERDLVRRRFTAFAARGNQPPEAVVDLSSAGGLKLQELEAGYDAVVGQPLLLSAERSVDAEGDRILTHVWEVGARRARGVRLAHRFTSPGVHVVRLTMVDEAGARSSATRTITVQPPQPPGCKGCCADNTSGGSAGPAALALLSIVGIGCWRRRGAGRRFGGGGR